ncbi:MAG TPA: N-formylglutamate deformylase [Usitatibacter sp.]|jgi:formiminoglutamase|nr:N-formylglutamate deformylase [Usitatibacter sp.]
MASALLPLAPFEFREGTSPLLVSMPHVGTGLPPCMEGRLSSACEPLGDTDWHLPRLYDFVSAMGASTLIARYTRFAVDLNRPPDDAPLYATATTGLHPDILFDGTPAFREGHGLTKDECAAFLAEAWKPYHARLAAELQRIRRVHGYALLFDAHSIAGESPRLFEGALPDFNIGTADGKSADASLAERVADIVRAAPRYRLAVNGRFKGGYITRHYGDPARDIHAVQLELAQRTYMQEQAPYPYVPERAEQVRPVLRKFVEAMLGWGRERHPARPA